MERSLQLLRKQRHSFLNHLQVLSGWLQLNRPERARQYLDVLASRMGAESEVLNRVPAAAGLFVLEVGLEAETFGVPVDWQVRGEVSDAALEAGRAAVSAALQRAAAEPEDERGLIVQLGPEGVHVHTPSDKGKG